MNDRSTHERTVLKLGGSVVTEKDEPEVVDEATLGAAAEAIGTAHLPGLVIVHGGGSFGHHHAEAHGVSADSGTHDATAVREIHAAMGRLNDAVVDALADQGVPAVPVHPFSLAHRDAEGETTIPAEGIDRLLLEGFVPVLHGDVVVEADAGASILSGDEIVVSLARSLAAARVGLCSTAPGVLDDDGQVIDRIDAYDAVADVLGASEATDVTGGMAGKVQALLALETPASIFGPADLAAFLNGGRPGTLVAGDR